MRVSSLTAAVAAFAVGLVISPLLRSALAPAHAAAAPIAPIMIDLMALKHDDLPKTPFPELNSRPLVVEDNATLAVQSGNVAKHIHQKTDEVQYIIEGSGAIWLGNERRDFKPGTLIIIPKGTPHAGAIVKSGPVKALVVKIPPQPADDTVFVQ